MAAVGRGRCLLFIQGDESLTTVTISFEGIGAMHVLLAEDDLSTQLMVRRMLQRNGHLVTVVANGVEALEAMELCRFDGVLMDIQMPLMDGFTATIKIRERERLLGFRTPIVAFTSVEYEKAFLDAGMDGYVSKPATVASLEAALHAALASSAVPESSSQQEIRPIRDGKP